MEEENSVYFRLEYNESLISKKELLSSEMLLLNMIKTIRRYNALRLEELKIKSSILTATRKMGIAIRKTKSLLPISQIPQKEKREEPINKKTRVTKRDESLESELREIQEKLRNIGR